MTKYIVFGTQQGLRNGVDMQLYMNRERLERVPHMKYLGVILDQHLTFDEHVAYLQSKVVKKLGIVRKARDFLDRPAAITLYKSLVLPHIDYCDIVYECTSIGNLQKL